MLRLRQYMKIKNFIVYIAVRLPNYFYFKARRFLYIEVSSSEAETKECL